jgi:iron complex transport system permease protein
MVSVMSALSPSSSSGMIPFVGLAVPNHRLAADRATMCAARCRSWSLGRGQSGLVLACDIAGRLVRYPYEIPVGTVMGVVGRLRSSSGCIVPGSRRDA